MANEKISDEVAIRMAAMDYEEGWFEGDANRMARCLHPDLAKRGIKLDPVSGKKFLNRLTKEDMVRYTREGGGTDLPREKLYYKVDVMEVFQEVAIVRAESYPYIDYLQLVKDEGQWLIVNILYTVKSTDSK
jgi:hypothetical protein